MADRGEGAQGAQGVLLVEDDGSLREAYRLVLSARGFEVRTAASGEEALETARERPPGAVVADLGLPGLSGPELVRALRRTAPAARILVLSGDLREGRAEACREAGADLFLGKPVTGDELADALRCSRG